MYYKTIKMDQSSQYEQYTQTAQTIQTVQTLQPKESLVIYPKNWCEQKLEEATFYKNMQKSLTEEQMEFIYKILSYDNIVIAGGFCTNMMRGILEFDDIDFFFTGTEYGNRILLGIIAKLVDEIDGNCYHYCSGNAFTFMVFGLKFQFVTRTFDSVKNIFETFDIGAACIAYDGFKLHISDRAILDFIKGYTDFNPSIDLPTYQHRLSKYFNKKGFGIKYSHFNGSLIKNDHKLDLGILQVYSKKLLGNGKIIGRINISEEYRIPPLNLNEVLKLNTRMMKTYNRNAGGYQWCLNTIDADNIAWWGGYTVHYNQFFYLSTSAIDLTRRNGQVMIYDGNRDIIIADTELQPVSHWRKLVLNEDATVDYLKYAKISYGKYFM